MLVPHGKPYAGKLHVRFDEGAGAPDEGRSALLYYGLRDGALGDLKKDSKDFADGL